MEVQGYVTNLADYIAAADLVVGKSGPNQVFETLLQERPIVVSSFLANEKETTSWIIKNRVGWLTRTPGHLATLIAKIAAHPGILDVYQRNIRKLKLRSGAPEICEFLYGLVKESKKRPRRTMGDALRQFGDAVKAEGEALSRRIDASEGMRRLKRAAAARKGNSRGARLSASAGSAVPKQRR